jgi:hypothetical protein
MPKIFDDNFDISTDGEFFWHATTVKNVFSMIKFDAGGLKPVGTGQLGAGFYLTGTRSDYQKAMARRSREDDEAPLFLFYVRVKRFYELEPNFLTRWDTSGSVTADFSAVCWYKEGSGAVGTAEKGGFIPSAKTGKREDFKYGEYRQERMFGTEIADKSGDERMQFMRALWGYARTDARPAFKEIERFGQVATLLPMLGARKILLRILLELAIKSESCLANSAIVGVKIFSPTVEPINLQFKYSGKSYDLKPAVLEENTLKTDDDPMNFHDESWLDLDKMVKILKA